MAFVGTSKVEPSHAPPQVRRFLTELSSSAQKIIDVMEGEERLGLAVLLDKVTNPSNTTPLELLGLVRSNRADEVMRLILREAKEELPPDRVGFEFGRGPQHPCSPEVFTTEGLMIDYAVYTMDCGEIQTRTLELPAGYQWKVAADRDFDEYYEVLCASFSENKETSIPERELARASYARRKGLIALLCEGVRIVGFTNVILDQDDRLRGEVHTIGLLPGLRGQKLGGHLLNHALEDLASLGARQAYLSVAAANASALHLYESFGFKTREASEVFVWMREQNV